MHRANTGERACLKRRLEDSDFPFHAIHGPLHWVEESAYALTPDQVDRDLASPSEELHRMCLEVVDRVVESDALMEKFSIPDHARDMVRESWKRGDPGIYGRFDLSYSGSGPAKLLEYNADTPTTLFEGAMFQRDWLRDMIDEGRLPGDASQFNTIHEQLVRRFRDLAPENAPFHFASFRDAVEEYATVEYLARCAREAGLDPIYTDVPDIGISDLGDFLDDQGRVMGAIFMLYPWEDMLRDEFCEFIPGSGCHFLEPAWKGILANKALLPQLWAQFEGHPNLLPAYFESDLQAGNGVAMRAQDHLDTGFVRKPLFGREGSGVEIHFPDGKILHPEEGVDDAVARIVQAYAPLPDFEGDHPLVSTWMIGDNCAGMGVQEDTNLITGSMSRFRPHFVRA